MRNHKPVIVRIDVVSMVTLTPECSMSQLIGKARSKYPIAVMAFVKFT